MNETTSWTITDDDGISRRAMRKICSITLIAGPEYFGVRDSYVAQARIGGLVLHCTEEPRLSLEEAERDIEGWVKTWAMKLHAECYQ